MDLRKSVFSQVKTKEERVKSNGTYDPRNQLNFLTGKQWIQYTKSVWFQKGLGKNHKDAQIERLHPAPFSFQDIAKLIEFFTKPGEKVLDPFCGVASTLKACVVTKREGYGVELVKEWVLAGKKRLETELGPEHKEWKNKQKIIHGDIRKHIRKFEEGFFNFAVTSPPYWKILNKKPDHKVLSERIGNNLATSYSNDRDDLANIESYEEFLDELTKVFMECYRVVKGGRYMCIVVGDFRHKNKYIPYHSDIIRELTEKGNGSVRFEFHGIIILVQNAKRLFPYGYPFAFVPNVHHQYILVFKKPNANK